MMNTLLRALVTFVEVLVPVLLVTGEPFSQAALMGAIGAGLSAAWNTVLHPALEKWKGEAE